MLLNIVTDEQLLTSQIVKTILLVILAVGIIFNFIRMLRVVPVKKRTINFVIFIFLTFILSIVLRAYRIEAALLKSPVFVSGTTLGYCNVFAVCRGIEFEYETDGKKFQRCNTFHPISPDSIKVPGGRYMVRISKKFPNQGRMDFMKKAD